MYDVITFGSATHDIFVKSKKFVPLSGKEFITGKGICLNLGSKNEVEDMFFSLGGGGLNAAATFVSQGLKTAFCGQVGQDVLGDAVIKAIGKLEIGGGLLKRTEEKPTNLSIFLTYPGKDRTILVYRGASDIMEKKDIPWQGIKNTKWIYMAPFSGKLAELTLDLVLFAKKNNIKIALNPGYSQLKLPQNTLKKILAKVDVLILNREEASLLTGIPYEREKEIFQKIDKLAKGICIMTKGDEGAVLSDGKHLFKAKPLPAKIVEKTGAGDAFGSGFVAGLIQKNDIVYATQLATANAAGCIAEWGAQNGLLKKNEVFKKVKVLREHCLPAGLCLPKK